MPRMSQSTMMQAQYADRYTPKPREAIDPATTLIPPRNEMARSPVMLASLPNVGNTPDAILRQHLGGRTTGGGRFL